MLFFLLSHNYRLLRRRRRGNLMPSGAHQNRKLFGGRLDFSHFALGERMKTEFIPFSSFPAGIACSTSVACTSK